MSTTQKTPSTTAVPATPAGWYRDPYGGSSLRWWDGARWTDALQAPGGAPDGTPVSAGPGRGGRGNRQLLVVAAIGTAVLAILVLVGLVVAIVSGNSTGGPRPTTTVGATPSTPAGGGNESTVLGGGAGGDESTVLRGGAHDDAVAMLGHDLFTDPVQSRLWNCGILHPENTARLLCKTEGWELTADEHMQISAVTLWNGADAVDTGVTQYTGPLPGGLAWTDSFGDVMGKLGEPSNLGGGNGLAMHADYEGLDGYHVEVAFTALHNRPDELAVARISHIRVEPPR